MKLSPNSIETTTGIKFKETISIKKWRSSQPPQQILVIRIQALGDVFIIFPIIYDLIVKYPNAKVDLLVRQDYALIPQKMGIFDQVFTIKKSKSSKKQALYLLRLLPKLWTKRYGVVLDLQRNRPSRLLRRLLFPKAWTEFDRFSGRSALIRNQWSVNQVGLGKMEINTGFVQGFQKETKTFHLLQKQGWNGQSGLVILNPAGAFQNRNWEVERYVDFIKLWLAKQPQTIFIILGLSKISKKALFIQQKYPQHVINLVEQTSLTQAYEIVLETDFMLTEDSGLGHFSWISGKKTLMMLGSTRSDWTKPFGNHTASFDSSDLPCGDCMLFECIHDTIICMDRLTPETVFDKAWELYQK